jgi:uncharacterized protein YukE
MSLEGMDVEQAQQVTLRLEANAQALSRITAMLAGLTAELGRSWRGPASSAFEQQWASQYRPALANAASALADMHAHLTANIQQQIQASAADSGQGASVGVNALTLTGLLAGTGKAWHIVTKIDGYETLVTKPPALLSELWLHDNPHVQRFEEIFKETHGAEIFGKLDKVGNGISYVNATLSGGEGLHELAEHHYASAGGDFLDGTASVLKTKGAVAYLAGFDISLLKKDYELAHQIQWSEGVPNPFNASNFENDWIPTFKSLPGQLVSTLAEVM